MITRYHILSLAILWLILKIIQKQLYVYRKSQCIITKIPRLVENMGIILTIMKNGEHWFHTEEQMQFLDAWIKRLEKLQSLKKAYLSEMFPQ